MPCFVTQHDHVATYVCAVASELLGTEWMVGLASDGRECSQLNPHSKKGPIITTAIIAGVQGVKRTSELIPFCHPLGLSNCKVTIELDDRKRAVIDCTCKVHHRTGVEMEALTGASVAALTVYDMCKALSHDIVISEIFQ